MAIREGSTRDKCRRLTNEYLDCNARKFPFFFLLFTISLLFIFSSAYACDSLFSVMKFDKSRNRSSLTDEANSSCISLKVTKYNLMYNLSAVMQQQKSH